MVAGYQAGFSSGAYYVARELAPASIVKNDPTSEFAVTSPGRRAWEKASSDRIGGNAGADRAFGTMVASLDRYFADHPDREKVLVRNRVACAIISGLHCP